MTSPSWPVTVSFPEPLLREASTKSNAPEDRTETLRELSQIESAKWFSIKKGMIQ